MATASDKASAYLLVDPGLLLIWKIQEGGKREM